MKLSTKNNNYLIDWLAERIRKHTGRREEVCKECAVDIYKTLRTSDHMRRVEAKTEVTPEGVIMGTGEYRVKPGSKVTSHVVRNFSRKTK